MPKIKTNRSASKRFSVSAHGKIKRSKAFSSHILTKKSAKRKRSLRKGTLLSKVDSKGIRRLIPYS